MNRGYFIKSTGTALCAVSMMMLCVWSAMAEYQPKDMLSWDYWFAADKETQTYHAFYLVYPSAKKAGRHHNQWVGHATSKDLWTWKTEKDALVPVPGTFNDKNISTGSIIQGDDGKWVMWARAGGTTNMGLTPSISDDLMTWKKLPEHMITFGTTFKAEWKGEIYEGKPLADPYIHPEKIDGLYWLTINTDILNPPAGMNKGAVLMMKSKDLLKWEPHRFVAHPGVFDRCETTQTWEHNGKWYLFFGGAGGPKGNHIYMADTFDGPYEKQPWSRMKLPDGQGFYIGKRIQAFDGKEYFLAGVRYRALSNPYPISYGEDGQVVLSKPEPNK